LDSFLGYAVLRSPFVSLKNAPFREKIQIICVDSRRLFRTFDGLRRAGTKWAPSTYERVNQTPPHGESRQYEFVSLIDETQGARIAWVAAKNNVPKRRRPQHSRHRFIVTPNSPRKRSARGHEHIRPRISYPTNPS